MKYESSDLNPMIPVYWLCVPYFVLLFFTYSSLFFFGSKHLFKSFKKYIFAWLDATLAGLGKVFISKKANRNQHQPGTSYPMKYHKSPIFQAKSAHRLSRWKKRVVEHVKRWQKDLHITFV